MGRDRFHDALAAQAVAFAPLAWAQVPALVRQPAGADWWRDPRTGQRLLDDVAMLAGADALVVCVTEDAVAAHAARGERGDDALERLVDTDELAAGRELIACLAAASPYAVLASLPTVAALERRFEASDPEVAEDALSDLARGVLEAGADALLVRGADEHEVRGAVRRVAPMSSYYGRTTLGARAPQPDALEAWVEGRPHVGVAALAADGAWPALAAGLVLTAQDVSETWEAAELHAVAGRRPDGGAASAGTGAES